MGNWSVQQEAKKEVKEKDKVRREKLAGFFFKLGATHICGFGSWWNNSDICQCGSWYKLVCFDSRECLDYNAC